MCLYLSPCTPYTTRNISHLPHKTLSPPPPHLAFSCLFCKNVKLCQDVCNVFHQCVGKTDTLLCALFTPPITGILEQNTVGNAVHNTVHNIVHDADYRKFTIQITKQCTIQFKHTLQYNSQYSSHYNSQYSSQFSSLYSSQDS